MGGGNEQPNGRWQVQARFLLGIGIEERSATPMEIMVTDTRGYGHSTNVVGVPTGLLASAAFNEHPVDLHIAGVRETNRGLFQALAKVAENGLADVADVFQDYMAVLFGLDPEQRERTGRDGRRRYRSSYLRLLKGWLFDANGAEGAVFKGWVESRFGLFPTYHKGHIDRFAGPTWIRYVEEKMSSRFHNNAIYSQLDLLFEYCQWAGAHHFFVGRRHLTLYRGINHMDEHQILERPSRHDAVVRLNNLVSFSSDRDIAGQFGDYILEAMVPVAKMIFFDRLLPRHSLKGEGEYLVIGGDYRVRVDTF